MASINENGVAVIVMPVKSNFAIWSKVVNSSSVRSFAPSTTIIVKSVWLTKGGRVYLVDQHLYQN
jgi:hypothetical protein